MTPTPGNIFNRIDLAGVGFARLDEYFGLWAMEASRFRLAWERASQMDLRAHVQETTPAKAQVHTAVVPVSQQQSSFGPPTSHILIVKASGVLMKQVPSGEHGTSTILLRRVMREARADSSIAGVIMVMDSPGGTVSGTADLSAEIALTNEVKPVWTFIEDLCASASYWDACACERIIANHRTAAVGSIGTILGLYDSSGWAAKQGIEAVVIATGDLKGAGFPGAPITDEQRAYFQQLINDTQASFAQAVEEGRGLSPATVAQLSTGGVWLADEALELGLIDAVQSIDQTIDEMRQQLSDSTTGGAAASASQENQPMPKHAPTAKKPTPASAKSKTPSPKAVAPKASDEEKDKHPAAEEEDPKPTGKAADDDNPADPEAMDDEGDEGDDECDCAGEDGCDCDKPTEPAAEDEPADDDEEEQPKAKPKASAKAPAQHAAKAQPVAAQARATEGQKFMKAFGPQGAVWYAEGKSFAQARKLHTEALQKENAELKAKLAGVDRGAAGPVKINGDASAPKVDPKLAANVGAGAARFASGLKLPKAK